MNEINIPEGNKLIEVFVFGKELVKHSNAECKYHTSLDWLMPVVEEIAKDYTVNIHSFPGQGFDVTFKEGNFRKGFGLANTAIAAIWIAVVDLLKNK